MTPERKRKMVSIKKTIFNDAPGKQVVEEVRKRDASIQVRLHPTLYTLHYTPYTLNLKPCTLHPAP